MLSTTEWGLFCVRFSSLGFGIGGGLYETRGSIRIGATSRLQMNWASGSSRPGRRRQVVIGRWSLLCRHYWLRVNVFLAWHQVGQVRDLWLMSSIAIVLKSIGTYGYFVPTYIRRISCRSRWTRSNCAAGRSTWTRLSPLRVLVETFAWIMGIWLWFSLRRAEEQRMTYGSAVRCAGRC